MVLIKLAKYAKICQNLCSLLFCIIIMSQVGHTRKYNSIGNENKSVKQSTNHQKSFNGVFLQVTLVLRTMYACSKKYFGLNRALLMQSTDWPSMLDFLNHLE